MAYNAQQQLDRTTKTAEQFLSEYRARARITERRTAKYDTPRYSHSPIDDYSLEYTVPIRHYNEVELTLLEDDLERLIEDVDDFKLLRRRYGDNISNYLNEAHQLLIQLDKESRVRKQNPGVQLAWERYQMMLKIAGGE